MYLRNVTLKNVRSVKHFEMNFQEGKEAGWHVLIGDNGSGKTTVLKTLTAFILSSLFQPYFEYDDDEVVPKKDLIYGFPGEKVPANMFELLSKYEYKNLKSRAEIEKPESIAFTLSDSEGKVHYDSFEMLVKGMSSLYAGGFNETKKLVQAFKQSGFLCAFGAHRYIDDKINISNDTNKNMEYNVEHKVINLFVPNAGIRDMNEWLKDLDYKRLKKDESAEQLLRGLFRVLNDFDLLPFGVRVQDFNNDGILIFKDGNGDEVTLGDLSSGYRSVLALVLEMIRHLTDRFGPDAVFKEGQDFIDCAGIVLIDEIDAHLHPTWQTRIGHRFTKIFPNLQFIVTTHSPLICRACEKGSIWRLAAPGSEIPSGEITGTDRDRLIYGNILDAYGTEVFGENVTQSEAGQQRAQRLAELTFKSYEGLINDDEEKEYFNLKTQMPTLRIQPKPQAQV